MNVSLSAPWHFESYTKLATETLPAILEKRLGIERAAEVLSALTLPEIMEDGWFSELPGRKKTWSAGWAVVARVATENLEGAEIRCVGEQLTEWVDARLTDWHDAENPPLADWVSDFFALHSQTLDSTNVLAQTSHLRRLFIEGDVLGWHPSHVGRACAVENPEGPNAGRILSIARGARISEGRLVPSGEILGASAGCIPFLAHTSDARALMGANMYRQFQRLPAAQPALIQSSGEPGDSNFWCGVNLRTAFISWGRLSHEDALILSESAAARLVNAEGRPLGLGDKLANRHGAKGVVGAILPDSEMPRSEDGRPIELVYPFFGVSTRMNHGQLLEAALGGAVEREGGQPALAPPFAGPTPEEVQARREKVGLSGDGLERLTDGASGEKLVRRSAVGIVYWGRLVHDAADKLEVGELTMGAAEYRILREAGAEVALADFFGGWAKNLLPDRLRALGISLKPANGSLAFAEPSGETVELGEVLVHPWIPEREILAAGRVEALPEWESLQEAALRLERMKSSAAPPTLLAEARKSLEARLWDYADALLPKDALQPNVEVARSGRSVCAPAPWPDADKIGLPGSLFDACDGAEWVLVRTSESLLPAALVALKPVRVEGDALLFPAQLCHWLDTDFDGDQLSIFAPSTAQAAEELGRLLSPAGQLSRDPARFFSPYGGLLLGHGAFYGLAETAREPGGIERIAALVGRPVTVSGLCLTRADLEAPLKRVLAEDGPEAAMGACVRLAEAGFLATKKSGASLAPFARAPFPPVPKEGSPVRAWEAWGVALDDAAARLPETVGFEGDALGPTILAAASGARGRLVLLVHLCASNGRGVQTGADGEPQPVAHGLRDGLTPEEWLAAARTYRLWLRGLYNEEPAAERYVFRGSGLLARALRSASPGVVLARAAESGETDPLTDLDSRLLLS